MKPTCFHALADSASSVTSAPPRALFSGSHPAGGREGLGAILVRETRRWILARAAGSFATYGFIEADNTASLAIAPRAGHERWGSFVAAPFTR